MRVAGLIVVLAVASVAFGTPRTDSLWLQPYGANGECKAAAIRQLADGGYILAGTEDLSPGEELRAVRVDSSGQVVWSRGFCNPWTLKVRDLRPDPDGDLWMVGTTTSLVPDSQRAFVMRMTADGDTLWTRILGETPCGAHAVQPTADGGCVLAGWEVSPDTGGSDMLLLKMDLWGHTVWKHRFDEPGDEWAFGLTATADHGFLIVGQGKPEQEADRLLILRTDSQGNAKSSQSYPLTGLQRIFGLEPCGNGFVVGGLLSPRGKPCEYFLVRMDSECEPLWVRGCPAYCNPEETVVMRPTLSGFIFGRHCISLGTGSRQIELYTFDQSGEFLYHILYDGRGFREWVRPYWYYESRAANSFAEGMYELFVNPHLLKEEKITIEPAAPKPERSEHHGPNDSFGNVYWAGFTLNHRQHVRVTVYDTTGQLIRTVADDDYGTGNHTEIFDGWNLSPGIYFLRVETDNLHETRKVALVR